MDTKKYKELVLDFSACECIEEIHKIIKEELELPDFYGANADALWDAIVGIMYVPVRITIVFKPKTSRAESLKESVEQIISIFKEAEKEYGQICVSSEL